MYALLRRSRLLSAAIMDLIWWESWEQILSRHYRQCSRLFSILIGALWISICRDPCHWDRKRSPCYESRGGEYLRANSSRKVSVPNLAPWGLLHLIEGCIYHRSRDTRFRYEQTLKREAARLPCACIAINYSTACHARGKIRLVSTLPKNTVRGCKSPLITSQ